MRELEERWKRCATKCEREREGYGTEEEKEIEWGRDDLGITKSSTSGNSSIATYGMYVQEVFFIINMYDL